MTFSDSGLPRVSVIVPVVNSPRMIRRCLAGLLAQNYPADRLEVLIADNGSTDETPAVIREHPVTLLVESGVRSPYAARNLALRHATGDVLAFTDADCVPKADWVRRGVEALASEGADLVGGHVEFLFSPGKTAAEMYDAIANLEMRRSITQRGEAKTGNLIVRRAVVDRIGEFPGTVRSGGDKFWSGRAVRSGFTMVYRRDVVVQKQARTLLPLLKKSFRIGRGHPAVWIDRKRSALGMLRSLVTYALPPAPAGIRGMIDERGDDDTRRAFRAVWTVAWIVALITTAGRILGFLEYPFRTRS